MAKSSPEDPFARRSGRLRSRLTRWASTLAVLTVVAMFVVPLDMIRPGLPGLAASTSTANVGERVTANGSSLSTPSDPHLAIDGSIVALPSVVPSSPSTSPTSTSTAIAMTTPVPPVTNGARNGRVTAPATGSATTLPDPTTTAPATPVPTATATANPKPTATANPTPTPTPTDSYYVATTGSDSNSGSSAAPWRTIGKAVSAAPAGSTIFVRSGTYAPFTVSRAHLDVTAIPGDTPSISGGTSGIAITASDTTIRDLRVTAASDQGIWVDTVSGVILDGLRVDHNNGHGIQIIRSSRVQILDSTISANELSGIRELDGTSGGRYVGNTITDNGHDGAAYNGDGLMLQGSGAYVASNTILRNGDSTMYEHGVYASSLATGYVITGNVIRDNAASGIKASGQGTVSNNTISGSVRGLVFADDGGTVKVTGNEVDATTYAILVMSNCVISRYDSDYNTFVLKTFGDGGALDLAGWRLKTGLDQHSN